MGLYYIARPLWYGWFLQNLWKDFIGNNMHTTVHKKTEYQKKLHFFFQQTRGMLKIQKGKLNIWDYPQIRNLYPDAWLNWAFVINGGLTLWKKGERGKSRNAITLWVEINSEIVFLFPGLYNFTLKNYKHIQSCSQMIILQHKIAFELN